MRNHGRNRAGFSLTELVIIVGVIAVLLAILLPVLNRARAAARVVQCTNNLKQIDTSIRTWSLKRNDMRLPTATSWVAAVRATIVDAPTADQILACPDAAPTVAVTTTTTPSPDTTLQPGVDFEKNNKPHSVTFTQLDANTWTADEVYHKNWPNHAVFRFTRVGNTNDWLCWPLSMDPKKATSVGPPLTIISVADNVTYFDVKVGQSYLIKGQDIAPITSTTLQAAASYGFNDFMDGARVPKGGRIVVMDYPKTAVDYNGDANDDAPSNYLIGRHYKNMHNALFTDGSVRLLSVKELDPTKYTGSLYDVK